MGRGLAAGDLDNDGRVDVLVVSQNEPVAYFHNRTEMHAGISSRSSWRERPRIATPWARKCRSSTAAVRQSPRDWAEAAINRRATPECISAWESRDTLIGSKCAGRRDAWTGIQAFPPTPGIGSVRATQAPGRLRGWKR